MDAKAIGELGANAVINSLTVTEFLSPYINKNDTEPTWDGNVYIYNSNNKNKSEMIGVVPVQVKGKENEDFSKDKITFSVDVSDIRNFLSDGGAIYFVVYVSADGSNNKIYYNALSPIKLKYYLEEAGGQQTKSIEFQTFTSENRDKENIFLNFSINSRKQTSFATNGMISIDDVQNSENIVGVSIPVSAFVDSKTDVYNTLFSSEVYMYASIKGSEASIPIEFLPECISVDHNVPVLISVNDKVYYNNIIMSRSKEKSVLKIGKSIVIEFTNDAKLKNIKFSPNPMLRDRVKDLEFFLNVLKFESISINDKCMKINPVSEDLKDIDVDEMTKSLEYYQKIMKALTILNVEKDIDLEKCTINDQRELDNIITAFVENKPVKGLKKDLNFVCKIKIQDILLMLMFQRVDDIEGTYMIENFFENDLVVEYGEENNKKITNQYSLLKKEDYLNLDNINYNIILSSYEKIIDKYQEKADGIFERANFDMLNMLSAYDEGDSKNKKLFNLVKKMAIWIEEHGKEEVSKEINLINTLQIEKRVRELTKDEVAQLADLLENNSVEDIFKVAICLLLDNQMLAEFYFGRMNDEEKDAFIQYPIYRFWNKS